MHKHVELLIGRLATDTRLRGRFGENPAATLRELGDQGFELNELELAALAAIDPAALRSFAGALDRRIQKAPLSFEAPDRGGAAQPRSVPEKEMVR